MALSFLFLLCSFFFYLTIITLIIMKRHIMTLTAICRNDMADLQVRFYVNEFVYRRYLLSSDSDSFVNYLLEYYLYYKDGKYLSRYQHLRLRNFLNSAFQYYNNFILTAHVS